MEEDKNLDPQSEMNEPQEAPQLVPKVFTDKKVLERASEFVLDQYRKAQSDHDSRVLRWLEFDEVYQNIRRRKSEDGAANIVDPEPFVVIETLTSNISEAFFNQDPPFKYVPSEESDDTQAEIMSAYRADHLRRIGIREKFDRSIKQAEIFGTCIVKTPWRKEVTMKVVRRKVAAVNPVTGAVGYKIEQKTVPFPKFDDMDWEFVSIFDFYPIGRGASIQDLDGCIHKVCKTYDELKGNERKTKKIDGFDINEGMYYNLDSLMPLSSTKIELFEYWGRIPNWVVTGKDEDRYTTFEGTISACINEGDYNNEMLRQQRDQKSGGISWYEDKNRNVSMNCAAIRCQENPFWGGDRPFLSHAWTPVDNEFYGIGVIQPIKELWDELNDTRNQLVDNKTLMLRQPMLEDVHANVQRNVNLTGKNVRIKCDDINGVKPLVIQNFQAEGWRNVASIKDDIRRSSAAVDSLQGVPLNGATSATEFSAIQQQAGVRLKSFIRRIDENLFKPFLDRAYQYDQQFAEFERFVTVLGEKGAKFIRVQPEQIYGTFDIVTNGVTQIENNVLKTNKLINFLSIVSRIPNIANLPEILKEIWVGMGFPESTADKIINGGLSESPEDIEAESMALQFGQKVNVKQSDNDEMHIQMHGQELEKLRGMGMSTPESEESFHSHISQHGYQLQQKMAKGQAQMEGIPHSNQGQLNQLAQNGGNPVVNQDVSTHPMQHESPQMQVAQ